MIIGKQSGIEIDGLVKCYIDSISRAVIWKHYWDVDLAFWVDGPGTEQGSPFLKIFTCPTSKIGFFQYRSYMI